MNDQEGLKPPSVLQEIELATRCLGFALASDRLTGSLLRTLAASKPGGRLLELGTGTGVATAWLLDGMNPQARLITVDRDEAVQAVARRHLGHDTRVSFRPEDAATLLGRLESGQFDLVFADAWAGKYTHLAEALRLLRVGGLYVIDDMLPQPTWPEGHAPKVGELVATLEARGDLRVTKLNWSTGLVIAAKVA